MYLLKRWWNALRAAWKRMRWSDREVLLFAICNAQSPQEREEAWLDLRRRGASNWDLAQVILRSDTYRLQAWQMVQAQAPTVRQLLWVTEVKSLRQQAQEELQKLGVSGADLRWIRKNVLPFQSNAEQLLASRWPSRSAIG